MKLENKYKINTFYDQTECTLSKNEMTAYIQGSLEFLERELSKDEAAEIGEYELTLQGTKANNIVLRIVKNLPEKFFTEEVQDELKDVDFKTFQIELQNEKCINTGVVFWFVAEKIDNE